MTKIWFSAEISYKQTPLLRSYNGFRLDHIDIHSLKNGEKTSFLMKLIVIQEKRANFAAKIKKIANSRSINSLYYNNKNEKDSFNGRGRHDGHIESEGTKL